MRIPQNLVEDVVRIYRPNYRYLQSVEMNFPKSIGKFQLGETSYMEGELQHLTDVEAQICLNQLCYVSLAQAILDNELKGLENMTLDKYKRLREEGMFITESHKKFKRETDPKKSFFGGIELIKVKKCGSIYLTKLNFNLNEGACIGDLSLVIKS